MQAYSRYSDLDNLGRVRLGYSGIRISSGGAAKTQTLKTQTSDPLERLKKIYIVSSSQF